MSTTIVGYERLNQALSKAQESAANAVAVEAAKSQAPDVALQQAAFQAGLNVALAKLQQKSLHPDILSVADHDMASLLQSFVAEKAAEENKLAKLPEVEGYEARFDEKDWSGWVKQFFTWWKGIIPHRWLEADDVPEQIPDKLRVAVLGDWGTGLYGAPVCARTIANDPAKFQLLLHLGDVYYSGTEKEVRERFLALWPKIEGAISRALNSNHEMYTGGHAYFQQTLREFNQKASYFALQNNDWLLVGLDTAYEDHDLCEPQVDWLRKIVRNASDRPRKLVMFSHHQPFSLIDGQGPDLQGKLADFLNTQQVFAWYWGHEHRCVIYDRHPTWGLYGRCIGHSGYPYFREPTKGFSPDPDNPGWLSIPSQNLVPGGKILDGPNDYVSGHEAEYGPNGYMTLEFSGPHLIEHIHDPEGNEVKKPNTLS